MKQAFVIDYRRGPAWIEGRSVFEQPLQGHLAYMRSLQALGTLVLGGPFLDDAGGLIVVRTEDADEARTLLQADPAVQEGVMVAEAHPWKLMAGTL
jgi:uncharacterized protein YciI